MKTLIAYFSATGTTEKLAKSLAKATNGDLFEIQPTIPYTDADLDWTNKNSRSSVEMADFNSRPEVSNKLNNMDDYDRIFIGFPIWWYVAPTIINTFLEQYDLTGKIIVPFATSGGSNMGKTNEMLKPSCPNSKLMEGKKFSANENVENLKPWAEKFN